jgi:hypothetical protein
VALDANQTVAASYGVEGMPHTVVIDPHEKVSWVSVGFSARGGDALRAAINQALEAKPAP